MVQIRLLETAIEQFGQHGFDGANTRTIAKMSGTAMSSITYHFGGKEGLYLAAAEHIAKCIRERRIATRLRPAQAELSRDEAIEQILAILDGFAVMMLDPQSENWARFIVREQQQPTEAFERLYQGAMQPVVELMATLLLVARPSDSEAKRRALAVMLIGQTLVMRVGRASVCRILGVEDLGEEERRLLRDQLRSTAHCILFWGPE